MRPDPMLLPLVILALLAAAPTSAAPLDVGGSWTGTLPGAGATDATLAQRDAQLTGWLALDDVPGVTEDVPVTGKAKRRGLVVQGTVDDTRVRWAARFRRKSGELRGRLRVRGPAGKTNGMLALRRADDSGPSCGADYFRDTVMPEVLVPVCGQCHVPGGLAELTTFRVTPDDPIATAATAVRHVDAAVPLSSRLLRKPRAELPHEGGQQLEVGSPRDEILRRWVELVAGCLDDGGGGGGQTGAQLFADYCASCHGPDAAGMPGGPSERTRPNIRCATRVTDAVTTGRGDAMPPIPELGAPELTKIEAHLASLCDHSGEALFASNCVTCHGSDARGSTSALGIEGKHIRCHRSIGDTVRNGLDDMPAFPGLDPADVSAIGSYLVGLCPPGTAGGDELFASNCARCHGDDAGGLPAPPGERRRPAVRCATAPRIADALDVGRGDAMPRFSGIVGADLNALRGFLADTCIDAGRTAADLYDGNCASCHGEMAAGSTSALGIAGPDVRCSSAEEFQSRIDDGEDDMPAFPELTPDAALIAAYVRGSFCQDD